VDPDDGIFENTVELGKCTRSFKLDNRFYCANSKESVKTSKKNLKIPVPSYRVYGQIFHWSSVICALKTVPS
jgi:hypothetical protein